MTIQPKALDGRYLTPLYDPQQYAEDKKLGVRRSSGARCLKRLNPRHRMIIALHLNGMTAGSIAKVLGVNPQYVSIVLNDPLVQSTLERIYEDLDEELRALFPKAVEALRDGLEDPDNRIKLKASDQFFRTQNKYKDDKRADVTAEDVIRRFMEVSSDGPVRIRLGEERRDGGGS